MVASDSIANAAARIQLSKTYFAFCIVQFLFAIGLVIYVSWNYAGRLGLRRTPQDAADAVLRGANSVADVLGCRAVYVRQAKLAAAFRLVGLP